LHGDYFFKVIWKSCLEKKFFVCSQLDSKIFTPCKENSLLKPISYENILVAFFILPIGIFLAMFCLIIEQVKSWKVRLSLKNNGLQEMWYFREIVKFQQNMSQFIKIERNKILYDNNWCKIILLLRYNEEQKLCNLFNVQESFD